MNILDPVIILGAGLSGLNAALKLKSNYRIIERENNHGGLCNTVEIDGFRFDKTGHLLHLSSDKVKRLAFDVLDETQWVNIKREARIFSSGVYTRYPFQSNMFGLPQKIADKCLSDFIKAHEQNTKNTVVCKTFEQFILANFGKGIADNFMIPYNTKLWGVHPKDVTADWCDKFVPVPKIEEVIQGSKSKDDQQIGYNANFIYPKKGIGSFTDALAAKVDNIEYLTSPMAIDFEKKLICIKDEWIKYKAIISSLPLDNLVKLLRFAPKKIEEASVSLKCTSLRYLDIALKYKPKTRYHWTYVPQHKYPFYRVGAYSNFSSLMAPKGMGNLYVELASRLPINMKQIMPKITEGLLEMNIINKADDVLFAKARLIKHAYVIYDKNYRKIVDTVLPWLEDQQIFSVGRYGKWEYSAMENAIIQGMEAAEKAVRKTEKNVV